MSCCNNDYLSKNESILIVNKAREAAACAEANCASSFTNATNAATSATNAAASAAAAAESAEIAGIYLGPKAVAPTTDNDGGPLQEGMLYFNTTSNGLFVWNGSAWVSADFNEFTNFTATGTTNARNLVTRTADVVNVLDFGADPTGVASSVNAFQLSINSFPNINKVCEILIPEGNYLGDFSTLNEGNRIIVLRLIGTVSFLTNTPKFDIYNYTNGSDKRPWQKGTFGFITQKTTENGWEFPTIDSRRYVDHTNSTGELGNNGRFSTFINVANPNGPESALTATIDADVAMVLNISGPNDAAAFRSESRRNVINSQWNHFGANPVAKDTTTRKSSISSGSTTIGGMVGQETNVSASGPDDASLRKGHQILMYQYATSPDAAGGTGIRSQTTMYAGEIIAPTSDVTLEEALVITSYGTNSYIAKAINIEKCEELGIQIKGNAQILGDFRSLAGKGTIILGSDNLNQIGDIISGITFVGKNDLNLSVNYSDIITIIQDNASGSTDASLRFRTQTNGVFTSNLWLENQYLKPGVDTVTNLGFSNARWNTVYAVTGTINTSDEREKTFLSIEDAEKSAALEIKQNIRKFKFNDAIEKKGENARIHFGASAQQVGDIMKSHGLDPDKYGFYCYDEWDETKEAKDNDGNIIQEYRPAGNRYGIRYEELLAFIISAL